MAKSRAKNNKKNAVYAKLVTLFSTSLYVGFLPKAPGTWGSLFGLFIYWLIFRQLPIVYFCLFMLLLLVVGIWATGEYDRLYRKHDASESVIDEVLGQSIVLLPLFWPDFHNFYPVFTSLGAFILFRFFDIVKPFGVWQIQKFSGGWGIMLDDVLAAIYAVLVWLTVMLPLIMYVA